MVDAAGEVVAVGGVLGRNSLSLHFEERYSEQDLGYLNLGAYQDMDLRLPISTAMVTVHRPGQGPWS